MVEVSQGCAGRGLEDLEVEGGMLARKVGDVDGQGGQIAPGQVFHRPIVEAKGEVAAGPLRAGGPQHEVPAVGHLEDRQVVERALLARDAHAGGALAQGVAAQGLASGRKQRGRVAHGQGPKLGVGQAPVGLGIEEPPLPTHVLPQGLFHRRSGRRLGRAARGNRHNPAP